MAKPKSPKKAKVNPFENDVVEKLKEKYKTKFEESSVPESKAQAYLPQPQQEKDMTDDLAEFNAENKEFDA